jgi:uncharacterized membrane protein
MAARSHRKSILPWRYGLFLLAFASALPFAMISDTITGVMIGFDLAAFLFMATMSAVFAHGPDQMRAHASQNDANRTLILLLTGIVMLVLLFAIASELRFAGRPSSAMLGLIIATLILAWLFSNLVYTFHYAFLYYRKGEAGRDHGGLDIPERDEPDYWDFAYFAFTLGMTFQTSDVQITAPAIRRVALFHSFAAFVFNLGIVAFTINILGS